VCANVVATRTTPPHGVPLNCTRWLALAAESTALTMTSGDDNMLLCRRGCAHPGLEAHHSLAFLTLRPAPFSLLISQEGFACGVQFVRGWRGCTWGRIETRADVFECCWARSAVSRARPNGEQRKSSPTRVLPVPLLCVNALTSCGCVRPSA
jgi:hypothetical protein